MKCGPLTLRLALPAEAAQSLSRRGAAGDAHPDRAGSDPECGAARGSTFLVPRWGGPRGGRQALSDPPGAPRPQLLGLRPLLPSDAMLCGSGSGCQLRSGCSAKTGMPTPPPLRARRPQWRNKAEGSARGTSVPTGWLPPVGAMPERARASCRQW